MRSQRGDVSRLRDARKTRFAIAMPRRLRSDGGTFGATLDARDVDEQLFRRGLAGQW